MPTYAYRCTACSHEFDIFQKFTDQPLTECPECGSSLRKVFQPVGIVFKGSGWYVNDSRAPEKDSAKADDKPAKTGDKPAKTGDKPAKTGDKPAKDGAASKDSTATPVPSATESSTPAAPVAAKAAAD